MSKRCASTSRPPTAPRCAICTRVARRARRLPAAPARAANQPPCRAPRSSPSPASRWRAEASQMSTTMAVVRMLGNLLKDAHLGPRVVPIVADEARTFGMASLFRQVGIYAPLGQLYEPEDLRLDALLPRGKERPDSGGRHLRGRRDQLLDRRGDQLQHARSADAAVLHLLLDVRLAARRRSDLGRRRPARARFSARRHQRPHHARRRRPAASGRRQSPGAVRDRAQLPRVRSEPSPTRSRCWSNTACAPCSINSATSSGT